MRAHDLYNYPIFYLGLLLQLFLLLLFAKNFPDKNVDVEVLRAQAYASMPASYIINYIY